MDDNKIPEIDDTIIEIAIEEINIIEDSNDSENITNTNSTENKITEKIKETTENVYKNVKSTTNKQFENYQEYKKTEPKTPPSKTNIFTDKISWDLIKVLFYIFILSFIVNDIQNFLFTIIIALLLFKLDILEPVFRFLRSIFKK